MATPIPLETVLLSSTPVQLLAGGNTIYAVSVSNPNKYQVFVKFYDSLAANVNPANSIPVSGGVLTVPAATLTGPGLLINDSVSIAFATAITARCTVNNTNIDTVSPATSPRLDIQIDQVTGSVSAPLTTNLIKGDNAGGLADSGKAASSIPTIPSVTNLLKGDGAGAVLDSGKSAASIATIPSVTNLLKGDGSGGVLDSGKAATAIIAAPPSTTNLLSGDGSGGFSNSGKTASSIVTVPTTTNILIGDNAGGISNSGFAAAAIPVVPNTTNLLVGNGSGGISNSNVASSSIKTPPTTANLIKGDNAGGFADAGVLASAIKTPPTTANLIKGDNAGGFADSGRTVASVPTCAATTKLLVGDGSGNASDSGVAVSAFPTANLAGTFPAASIAFAESNLSGGTALVVGTAYYDTLTGDRTLVFSGTPTVTTPPTVLKLAVDASGPYTLTFPTSFPVGETGSITSRQLLANTTYEFNWVWTNLHSGSYQLADSTSDISLPSNITPAALTGNVADYSPSGLLAAFTLRLGGGAADRQITGIASNNIAGRLLRIVNIGTTNTLILKNQNTGSVSANRFLFANGDMTIPVNGTITIMWDDTSGFWREWETPGAAGAGTGTVTHTAGSLTSNAVVLGAGSADTKAVTGVVTDGTSQLQLGVAGTSVGSLLLNNATSGTITIQPPTGALGTKTLTAPATTGTLVTTGDTATVTGAMIATDVALGGNPTTSTQTSNNNSTRIATTAYVDAAVSASTSGHAAYAAASPPTTDVGPFVLYLTGAAFGQNGDTAQHAIFTVPTGRTFVITGADAVITSFSGAVAGAVQWVIQDGPGNNLTLATAAPSHTPASGFFYSQLNATGGSSPNKTVAAAAIVYYKVLSLQASTSIVCTVFVRGYYCA